MSAQLPSLSKEAFGEFSPSDPPIDAAKLLEQCMGNVALVTMLFDKFETQARDDLARLAQALAARDAGTTARISHSLKGAAGALTARALHAAAADVELAAREDRLDAASQVLHALSSQVDRCLAYLAVARTDLERTASNGPARRGAR